MSVILNQIDGQRGISNTFDLVSNTNILITIVWTELQNVIAHQNMYCFVSVITAQ